MDGVIEVLALLRQRARLVDAAIKAVEEYAAHRPQDQDPNFLMKGERHDVDVDGAE